MIKASFSTMPKDGSMSWTWVTPDCYWHAACKNVGFFFNCFWSIHVRSTQMLTSTSLHPLAEGKDRASPTRNPLVGNPLLVA